MNEPKPVPTATDARRNRSAWTLAAVVLAAVLGAYFVIAYVVLPLGWIGYAHRHPALEDIPNITYTNDDHPGDPINVALIGSEHDLKVGMIAGGWYPADPVTLKSSLEIAAGTVLKRPYDDAPVSPLYLYGRKQDLAFEQPVGNDPRQRHHVRFWKSAKLDDQNRPLWAGSVTYDKRVGLSHTTGEITHHIAADVDAERDHLFQTLKKAGAVTDEQYIDGFHKITSGKNGGGDPWHTDGRLLEGVLQLPDAPTKSAAPE